MPKKTRLFFLFVIAFWSCNSKPQDSQKQPLPAATRGKQASKFQKLNKLTVTGDFDGDKITDTLYQHNFSKLTHVEIDSSLSPFENEWDEVIHWFYDQDSDVYLTLNNAKTDTLHLGVGQGLYCLINIGDNNGDGKDEVALSVDYCDYSRINTCQIYTLCNTKWTLVKEFEIHEDAFNFKDEEPIFTEIKGYLEKQNGRWVYHDNAIIGYDSPDDVGKMLRLKPKRCK